MKEDGHPAMRLIKQSISEKETGHPAISLIMQSMVE